MARRADLLSVNRPAERLLRLDPCLEPLKVRPAALGRLPSFAADESGHSAAYSLNVGNLRDTGHSDGATPPAAMAEDATSTSSW